MYPRADIKLKSSASEQNVFLTYVCTINDVKRKDTPAIDNEDNIIMPDYVKDVDSDDELYDDHVRTVERSKALYELIEAQRDVIGTHYAELAQTSMPTSPSEPSDPSENKSDIQVNDNPKILRLTKMKWLTEDRDGSPDSSSDTATPVSSEDSITSGGSRRKIESVGDKCLSTILRLDKEHNLFGLSNIAIVGSKTSRKIRKDESKEKAVFHQTAIVQVCCGTRCCRHKSNTDLPGSLKCGSCRSCCTVSSCSTCLPCPTPIPADPLPPCPPPCVSACPKGCKGCPSGKCLLDCNTCFGLKISLKKKQDCEPGNCELTPRSSCVLLKPVAARPCQHQPRCIPPSPCFPYLMPCYWPPRPSAPCNNPTRCFHNPPCLRRLTRSSQQPGTETCARPPGKCADDSKKTKCENPICPGNNPDMKKQIESRFQNPLTKT